jgi:adenylosuccinate synthase
LEYRERLHGENRRRTAVPVTIVVGGQFGSEGKGKVAHFVAREKHARAVVRVGGSNSGHTAYDDAGLAHILRQLPTAALLPEVMCVLPAGSYVDPTILVREVEKLGLPAERVLIDRNAVVITQADRKSEEVGSLGSRIGSTCSGTGAAVAKRIARRSRNDLAGSSPLLEPFLGDAHALISNIVADGGDVVVEGTQGFGLSVLHAPHFPKVTSRDTTAAGVLAECGLSPFLVDEIVLVLRSFPIRVSGNSGPFGSEEISWRTIQGEGEHPEELAEYTSVTGRLRRVARFDPGLVRRAISVNRPSCIVLNHLDHVDAQVRRTGRMTPKAREFVGWVSGAIGQNVDYVGISPEAMLEPSAELLAA